MCGGQSKRMGTDKGLMPQGDHNWAQLCYAKLTGLGIRVVVSVNTTQVQPYQKLFDELVIDDQNIPGPLNGILSVHAAYPSSDVLILACDMIAMDNDTLQGLITAYAKYPGHDIYAYHNGSFYEPLCAIYTSVTLAELKLRYQTEKVDNFSLQQVLKTANTRSLHISNAAAFSNFNSK